jgi:signal transduction histidine kinase
LLTEQLSKQDIASRVEIDGVDRRLPTEVEVALFRIAQEALHNVGRHSQATEALVQLQFGDKQVSLKVVDNGRGFEAPEVWGEFASSDRLGLIGMQERARLIGASMSVQSQRGKGTAVTVKVGA